MSGKKGASLSILTMVIILAATEITLDKLGKSAIAQGQENITEEQKAAMCDPNNPKLKFVNGTESRICGIPKTIKNTTSTTTANMTTGAQAPGLPLLPPIIP